jgi:hypothetical protein
VLRICAYADLESRLRAAETIESKEYVERAVQATTTSETETSGRTPGTDCATCSGYAALVDKNAELVETTGILRAELRSFRAKKLQQDALIKELQDTPARSSSLPWMQPQSGLRSLASPPPLQLASLFDVSVAEDAVMRIFIQLEQSGGRMLHKIELCHELMTRDEISRLISLVT